MEILLYLGVKEICVLKLLLKPRDLAKVIGRFLAFLKSEKHKYMFNNTSYGIRTEAKSL